MFQNFQTYRRFSFLCLLLIHSSVLFCQVNNAIFVGSIGDGYDAFCFEQASSNSIFGGSSGDGYDGFCFEQSATNNIFGGSSGDGYDALCLEQAATNPIFGGSQGDGYVMYCFEQSATNSIFGGSMGDGYDLACFEVQATNSIFGGSMGDGYDAFCFEMQATNSIFGGSVGDGYDMQCEIINPAQLPIELLVFDGVLEGDYAILKWLVETEIDNDYFVLEKSLDALEFEEVVEIQSLGNTFNIREYHYPDFVRPLFGNPAVYYRLKQVDLDGSFEYSQVIALNLPGESLEREYIIYPNPAKETIIIRYLLPENEDIEIEIFDNLGRIQISQIVPAASIQSGEPVQINHLPSGTYHVRILDGSNVFTKSFIKISP